MACCLYLGSTGSRCNIHDDLTAHSLCCVLGEYVISAGVVFDIYHLLAVEYLCVA